MTKDLVTLVDEKIDRSATMDEDEMLEKRVRTAREMKQTPLSLEVNVAGYQVARLLIEDPAEMIAQGGQGLRLDSEVSEDGGQTWRPHGSDVFAPKQRLTSKSQATFGKHFVEERAIRYELFRDTDGHEIIQSTSAVFPDGMLFRWHVRQLTPGKIGLSAELEK